MEARRLFNRVTGSGTAADWDSYKEAQRKYKRAIRQAKRESWRGFCASIDTLPEVARLRKILNEDPKARLDTLELPDGGFTESPEEALNVLMHQHFPGPSGEAEEATPVPESRRPVKADWDVAREVVTEDKVRWAINSFAPFNVPWG